MGVKRADKRKMDEKRVEVGVKEHFTKTLVRSTWAGHVGINWVMKKWQREQIPRKWRGNGGGEDRHCDGKLH